MTRSSPLAVPLLLALATAAAPLRAQEELEKRLDALPGATVEEIKTPRGFVAAYEIHLIQPLDHSRPAGPSFEQRIYLSHRGFDRPMVLNTEGYAARVNSVTELSRLLAANQIVVEHRFFGKSRPQPLRWRYLTVAQAAADHHRVIELFKKIYPGKWISCGISKGGQCALIHRRYYPSDVDATCAYVAPINRSLEDERIDRFFSRVGTAATRRAIERFQILVLNKRAEILPRLAEYSHKRHLSYERIGAEVAFEYGVLEYPFSFWQWGKAKADSIPTDQATIDAIFEHFVRVVDFYYYSDRGLDFISTFFYQSSTELGYYGYLTGHLKGLLKAVKRPDNRLFAPLGVKTKFNPAVMKDVQTWLQTRGEHIITIYGALDPWSASAIEPAPGLDAIRIMKAGACHSVRIRNLDAGEKHRIGAALERWMGIHAEALLGSRKGAPQR